MPNGIAAEWAKAHADLRIVPDPAVLDAVEASWRAPNRRYHATSHLIAGLRALDAYGPGAALVRLAWFFHDAIYIVGASDNERRSADWFSAYATVQGLSADAIARGHTLILDTRDHQGAVSDDPLWPIMNDVDLGVFAAPAEVYDRYADGVWLEYAVLVSRSAFAVGRAAFMSQFVSRPIFLTPQMKPKEPLAHANIAREVARLQAETAAGERAGPSAG